MGKTVDVLGQTFGRWTVVSRQGSNARNAALWLCVCECGQQRLLPSDTLRSGASKSCGCAKAELNRLASTTHGKYNTPEYSTWRMMIDRCENPRGGGYPAYGGRGIRVCPEWREDFAVFLADVGERPTPKHTLERVDNDGHYEPGNCKWITRYEQARNRRSNRFLTHQGEVLCITDWSIRTGISVSGLAYRLDKLKWSVDRALTTPLCRTYSNRGNKI